MVLVPLKHAPGPVHHARAPLRQAPGHVPGGLNAVPLLPGPVALQVGLVHDVDAVSVAQAVPGGLVGVVAGAHGIDVIPAKDVHSGGHIRHADGPARVRVPLVAVDAAKDDALPVEQHQPFLQLKPPEAGLIGDDLTYRPIRGGQGERHPVQRRRLVAPGANVLKPEGLAAQIPALPPQLQGSVEEGLAAGGLDFAGDPGALRLPAEQQAGGERPGAVVLLQPGLKPQVLQVEPGLGVEEHGAEDAAEAEEVLILDPRRAGALVNLHAQPVALVSDVGGEVEVRGREGVLRVAHELAVEPDVERLLHPLEANTDPLVPQSRVQVKRSDVAAHRGMVPVNLRRPQSGAAVPGVEGVDILDLSVPLQFHMSRHLDGPKGGVVKVLPPEVRRTPGGGLAPGEAPCPVQALAQGGLSPLQLLQRGAAQVVGVGVQPVHLEHGGVCQPLKLCAHSRFSFSDRLGGPGWKGPAKTCSSAQFFNKLAAFF